MTVSTNPKALGNTFDSLGRRSRFQRQPSGKRLVLGSRDLDILSWLYRYRYLRQTHLLELMRPKSTKRFVERLGDLYHETGFINRPAVQVPVFEAVACPMLYEISDKGIDCLIGNNALPHRAVTMARRTPRSFCPQLLHTVMIIETLVALEIAIKARPDQRFVPVDEILVRAPDATRSARNPLAIPVTLVPNPSHRIIRNRKETVLIPDGLYGIEYESEGDKRYRFWALECERTSPKWRSKTEASSTALKLASYDALITSGAYRSHWGLPNLKLHLVSGNARSASFS